MKLVHLAFAAPHPALTAAIASAKNAPVARDPGEIDRSAARFGGCLFFAPM